MIKAQTAVKGVRQEGGRKEGRRSVSWRDVVGRICRRRRRRRNTGVACSKQRFGLTEALYMIVSTRVGQKLDGHFQTHTLVKSAQTTEQQKQLKSTSACAEASTNLHVFILMHTTRAKADMQLHAHVRLFLAGGSLDSGNEIQFLCSNFFGDETLEDSTVCPVCKRISFFLLLSLFFFCQACFVDCFSSAFCPLYLSVCFLSFSFSFFFYLVRSPLAQSGLSGL